MCQIASQDISMSWSCSTFDRSSLCSSERMPLQDVMTNCQQNSSQQNLSMILLIYQYRTKRKWQQDLIKVNDKAPSLDSASATGTQFQLSIPTVADRIEQQVEHQDLELVEVRLLPILDLCGLPKCGPCLPRRALPSCLVAHSSMVNNRVSFRN